MKETVKCDFCKNRPKRKVELRKEYFKKIEHMTLEELRTLYVDRQISQIRWLCHCSELRNMILFDDEDCD